MEEPEDLVSIEQAANAAAVSRRTIERWIRQARLSASQSVKDRRVRLVSKSQVSALAATTRGKKTSTTPITNTHEQAETGLGGDAAKFSSEVDAYASDLSRDYQNVIDQALQLVYSHTHRMIHRLNPKVYRPSSLEQLRSGPLGQDLSRLAQVARGEVRERPEHVLLAIETILQLLFWPAAADNYIVPRSFWDTDLGRMLASAKFRSVEPSALMSIQAAAEQLGVPRPTIYRWMDDRTLNYVRDDMSGRTFLMAKDVENLKNVARQIELERPESETGDPDSEPSDSHEGKGA